jgi:hypothetical protein
VTIVWKPPDFTVIRDLDAEDNEFTSFSRREWNSASKPTEL